MYIIKTVRLIYLIVLGSYFLGILFYIVGTFSSDTSDESFVKEYGIDNLDAI